MTKAERLKAKIQSREWRAKNKEKYRAYSRERQNRLYATDPAYRKMKIKNATDWRLKNRVRYNAYLNQWQKKNQDKVRLYTQRYLANKAWNTMDSKTTLTKMRSQDGLYLTTNAGNAADLTQTASIMPMAASQTPFSTPSRSTTTKAISRFMESCGPKSGKQSS